MTEPTAPPPAEAPPARAPRSLWADARSRLVKNRLAVASLVWLVFISIAAALAPWIVPFDPQHQEWWIGKREPLYKHATLELTMTFAKDRALPAPIDSSVKAVALTFLEGTARDVRIKVDGKDVVTEIELGPDIEEELDRETPETLALRTGERLKVETESGTAASLSSVVIATGKPLPAELGGAKPREGSSAYVVLASLRKNEKTHKLDATVQDAKVAKLEKNGIAIPSATVRAEDVVTIDVDGKPFEHTHLLGTDDAGRDILSRVIFGGRISLMVGIIATVVSLIIGVSYGAISGYAGGRVDELMMRIVDILYAIPFMFFVIILLVLFGRSLLLLFMAIGAVEWLTMARIVRGQVLSLKEKEFVEAARVAGTSPGGIVFGHLVPNSLGAVIVYTTLTIPEVILTEAFLSFLGLSVQYQGQALESWGSLTEYGTRLAQGGFPWLLAWSSLALSLTLFALNFLGDGLRDALDPRLRGRG